jgi:hypothetical protein
MEKIHLTKFINASPEKVWDTMLDDATYREWTKAFYPGSYYTGDWSEGSKMLFLGPNPEGAGESGMVSKVKENRPHEFISIEHLGIVANGVEDTTSDATKGWAGIHENYSFREKDGGTELVVDMDIAESEKESMEAMWIKGLESLKELAENN